MSRGSEVTPTSGLVALGAVGLVALVLAAVDAGASLLAPGTPLLMAVGFVGVGEVLSTRWAIVTGAAVATAHLVAFEWFGSTGSVGVLGVLPPLLVAVGSDSDASQTGARTTRADYSS